MRYFISGHRDISDDEFDMHYAIPLKTLISLSGNSPIEFVVGDYYGVDEKAQDVLFNHIKKNVQVTVYHMFDSPRNNKHKFKTIGGFKNDHERDSAMTLASDHDIAWIRAGKEGSGTAQNILRRQVLNCLNKVSKKQKKKILDSWKTILKLTD